MNDNRAIGGAMNHVRMKSLNKKLPLQKNATVCHDELTRQLIPIFEFVTTDQTEFSINIYLQKAKNLIN